MSLEIKIMKRSNLEAYALIFVAAVLLSLGPPLSKKTIEIGLSQEEVIFYFFLIAFLFGVVKRNKKLFATHVEKKWKLLVAGISWFAMITFYVKAFTITSVTEAATFSGMRGLFSVILAIWLLKEKVRSWKFLLLAIFMATVAVFYFIGVDVTTMINMKGSFLILGMFMAVTAAISKITRESLRKDSVHMSDIMTLTTGIAAFASLIAIFVVGISISVPSLYQIGLLLSIGIGTIWFPGWITLKAAKKAGSLSKLNFIDYSLPVITAVFAFLINAERGFDYPVLIVSFCLIITSMFFANKAIA